VAAFATAVVCPSTWLAERVVELGFAPEVVTVVPSGVDTAFFSPEGPTDGPPVVAFVGRLVEKKGVDVLLAAWPAVAAAVPGARLDILGDGPLADRVRSVGPGVRWIAPSPARRAEQVRSLLRDATVVATPSRTSADGDAESLLLVNLEAAATGRPVVTTRHGGIVEFVREGETALVVPEADAAALADALVCVLRDPALAARLGSAGVGLAAGFDVRSCTSRRDDVVEAAVAGRRLPDGVRA
jgi:glycosyltransferase involved in cell wall biosynthesis